MDPQDPNQGKLVCEASNTADVKGKKTNHKDYDFLEQSNHKVTRWKTGAIIEENIGTHKIQSFHNQSIRKNKR